MTHSCALSISFRLIAWRPRLSKSNLVVFFNVEGARCLSVTPSNYRNTSRWDKDTHGMGRKAMKDQSLAERQEILDVSEAGDVQIEGLVE